MAKKSKKVLIDTGVIFDFLEGVESVRKEILDVIGISNAYVSTITHLETFYNMRKNEEKATKQLFQELNHIRLDKETSMIATGMMLSYRREKVGLPDCLIASVSIAYGMELYTLNIKDFDYIKGVKLYKPKNKHKPESK